jgi:NIMA (never in mitosis gene a)-related kinase
MKSDIWSLGCILYEMQTRKRPFSGRNIGDVLCRVMARSPAPLPTQYSQEIRDLTLRLLAKRPNQRPTINEIFQLPLIRNKAVALLGKTLARVELNHGVFHGCRAGQSPADVSDEVTLAIEGGQDAPPGEKAGIYREMQRMAENLQQILQSDNLLEVPEEVQQLNSGEFYFMGRKLCLRKVRPDDSLAYKLEALRVFMEELLSLDRIIEIYHAVSACDGEELPTNLNLANQSEVYVFQLIMQLVAYENLC